MEESEKKPGYLGRVEGPGIEWDGDDCRITEPGEYEGIYGNIVIKLPDVSPMVFLRYCMGNSLKGSSLAFYLISCEFREIELSSNVTHLYNCKIDSLGVFSHKYKNNNKISIIKCKVRVQLGINPNNYDSIDFKFLEARKVYILCDSILSLSIKNSKFESLLKTEARIDTLILKKSTFKRTTFFKIKFKQRNSEIPEFIREEYLEKYRLQLAPNIFISKVNCSSEFPILIENIGEPSTVALNIDQGLSNSMCLKTKNIDFDQIKISNYLTKGYLEIISAEIRRIDLKNLNAIGKIKLTDCNISNEGILDFNNAFISHLELLRTNFLNTKQAFIDGSSIDNLVLSGSTWFTRKALQLPQILNFVKYDLRNRYFRVIRVALDKQNDKINTTEFRRLEMDSLRKALSLKNRWQPWWQFRYLKDSSWLVLQSGRTNNYGTSWSKPTWFLLAAILFFHTVFWSFEHPYFLWSWAGFGQTIGTWAEDYLSKGLQLLNPFDGPKAFYACLKDENLNLVKDEIHGWTWALYLSLFLYRIVLAFLVYQIITGFRRLVKYEE